MMHSSGAHPVDSIRRRPDGTIDCDFYVRQSRERWASEAPTTPEPRVLSPIAKRHLKSWAIAFVLATGAFFLTMAKDPPKSVASDPTSNSPRLEIKVPSGLPAAEAATRTD